MKIRDISDRVYQGQVYALLDQAQSSIVISMYIIRPGDDPKHPVNRLLEDLIQARARGVEVTIYMNTKFQSGEGPGNWVKGPWFERLRAAGVKINLVSPLRRLHDKLLIVDRRFVIEGSMNWSVTAIADNFESATLIESPELAEMKLKRISFLPIWGEEKKKVPAAREKRGPEPLFPAGPPASIEIPILFLEEPKYFPAWLSEGKDRQLKIFLLLIYLSQAEAGHRFLFSPESAGIFLDILPGENATALRRQVIRTLRDLGQTGLVRTEFSHGRETQVEMLLPEGPSFTVGSTDLQAGELGVLSDNEIFLRLVQARLREEGKSLKDLRAREIEKRFFIRAKTFRRSRKLPLSRL